MSRLTTVLLLILVLRQVPAIQFPKSIADCCLSRGLQPDKCRITAAASGPSGNVHLFSDDLYVRITGIRPNGFPVVNRTHYPVALDKAFPGIKLSHIKSAVKFLETKILIVGQSEGVEYDDVKNRIGKRHPIDCKTKNILCPPDAGDVTEALLFLPNNENKIHIWSSIVKKDGRREIVVYRDFEGDIIHRFDDGSGFKSIAGVVYDHSKDGYSYGYDFLADGRAIPFSLPFGSYAVRDQEIKSREPGIASKVFLGCPPSFCFSTQFDDAMLYRGKLRIFSGPFFWDIQLTDLPLKTPTPETANEITGMETHIDAITELGTGDRFLYFKDDEVVFMMDDQTIEKRMSIEEFIFGKKSGHAIDSVDAAWFNQESKHLLIFRDAHYYEMEVSVDGIWTVILPKERLIVADFKINVQDIDAVFTLGKKAIILKHHWFYTIPEAGYFYPSTAYAANLAIGSRAERLGLFDTMESCSLSKKAFIDFRQELDTKYGLVDTSESGRKAMSRKNGDPSLPNLAVNDDVRQLNGTDSPPKSTARVYWPYVVVVALVVILLVVAVYFIWCRKSVQPKNETGVAQAKVETAGVQPKVETGVLLP